MVDVVDVGYALHVVSSLEFWYIRLKSGNGFDDTTFTYKPRGNPEPLSVATKFFLFSLVMRQVHAITFHKLKSDVTLPFE